MRGSIERRVGKLEAEENFRLVAKELERGEWPVPLGFSVSSMREDCDSG